MSIVPYGGFSPTPEQRIDDLKAELLERIDALEKRVKDLEKQPSPKKRTKR